VGLARCWSDQTADEVDGMVAEQFAADYIQPALPKPGQSIRITELKVLVDPDARVLTMSASNRSDYFATFDAAIDWLADENVVMQGINAMIIVI
jgi:hypothetical protein